MRSYDDIEFDQVIPPDSNRFTEYSFANVVNYIVMIITLLLQIGFLGSDIYTLIQIYALDNWDSMHAIAYVPILVYRIVFTVCIGLSFVYLFIVWGIGIKIFKSSKITRSYLTETARSIDSIQSFEKFCLFQKITAKDKFEWLALLCYQGFHYSFYGWLIADTPRQLLNGATIASSLSNSFHSGNIIETIKLIASKDNKTEAVLLSFMFFSFVIWVLFSAKYIFIIFSTIHVVKRLKRENPNYESLTVHCIQFVSDSIYELVEKTPEKRSSGTRDNSIISSDSFENSLEKPLPSYATLNNSTTSLLNPFSDPAQNPFNKTQSIPLPQQSQQAQSRNGSIVTNNDDPFAPRQRMDSVPLSIRSQRTLPYNDISRNNTQPPLPRFNTNNTNNTQLHSTPPLPPLAKPETNQYRLHKQHSQQSFNSNSSSNLLNSKSQPQSQPQPVTKEYQRFPTNTEENPFDEELTSSKKTTLVAADDDDFDDYEYFNKRESNPFAEEVQDTGIHKDGSIVRVSSYSTNSSESNFPNDFKGY